MSGGRFLVGLREVENLEGILRFRWPLKASIHLNEPTLPEELLQCNY